MRENRKRLCTIIVLGSLVILAVPALYRCEHRSEAIDADPARVRVVKGATPSEPGTTQLRPEPAASAVSRSDGTKAMQAAMIQAFPMLHEVQVECDPDCMLIATLGPNATTGDWPRSQWPYDGNLERFLASRGYAPRGPLKVDQPGDNDTLLRVPIRLPGPGGTDR